MAWSFNFNVGRQLPNYVERDRSGNFFYSFLDNFFGSTKYKIIDTTKYTLESIALLTIRKFIADYGSLAKFHAYKNNKLVEEDYFYQIADKPNPNQTWTELIWQYLFYASAENVYIYVVNSSIIYLLKKENIKLDKKSENAFKQLYFSDRVKRSSIKGSFKYKNENGTDNTLDLEKLFIIDFMSGVDGDWFNGASLFNAIKPVVDNTNSSVRSKGRNLFYTEKILVSKEGTDRLHNGTIKDNEHESLTNTILDPKKPVHASKGTIEVNQLVSNLKQLGLDEAYNNDFAKISRLFNIPSELIDLIQKGGIFNEGTEKALGLFVYYTIVPMLNKLTDLIEFVFELEDLRPSFSHCPFNAVFEKEKQMDIKLKLENLKLAFDMGADVSQQIKDITNGNN
jgi:hypothetical protein